MDDKDVFLSKPDPKKTWDVIIIGSGPAAFTAAIYTTRGAASTLIIGGENWGGQLMLTTLVENFPGFPQGIDGPDLMAALKKQAEKFGADFLEVNATNINLKNKLLEVLAGDKKYLTKSIIIATGALTKWLGVPGEKELIGRGVATCAPCDAPLYKEKIVAVVGGGDSAMEEAFVLTKYAKKVYVINRSDKFRASEVMQKKVLQNKKIEVIWNTQVTQISGEKKVEKVILFDNKQKTGWELPLDGIFIAVGHKPDSDIFKGIIGMDEAGFIRRISSISCQKGDGDCGDEVCCKYPSMTNIPGVFVAGDVHDNHYKQAITAAGFGCQAAMDSLNYLDTL